MTDRDRAPRERETGFGERRSARQVDRGQDQGGRRRERAEFDEESFDLPAWGAEQSRSAPRAASERPGREAARRFERPPEDRRPSKPSLPTLGDAFQRSPRRTNEPSSRSSATRDEPSLHRTGRSPRAQTRDIDTEQSADYDPYGDTFLEHDEFETIPPERGRRAHRGSQTNSLRTGTARAVATRQLGGMLASADPQTRLVASISGLVIVSLVLMSATLLGRLSSLPEWIPIHLNAEGEPDSWGTNETLWRIPLMVLVFTLMSASVAWYLRARSQFGARFLIMASLLIHVTGWIALANFVW